MNDLFSLCSEQYSSESRLVISLYKSNSSGCDEMVGCMSFGLSNLLLKYSSHPEASADSYILLNRTLGMKKHLRTSQVSVTIMEIIYNDL